MSVVEKRDGENFPGEESEAVQVRKLPFVAVE